MGNTIVGAMLQDYQRGGRQHRKEIKQENICLWLVQNNFPEGFQLLCNNCNLAKGFYGECPHTRVEEA